jgi:hypothetical protein
VPFGGDSVVGLENWTYIEDHFYRWKGGLGGHGRELEGSEKGLIQWIYQVSRGVGCLGGKVATSGGFTTHLCQEPGLRAPTPAATRPPHHDNGVPSDSDLAITAHTMKIKLSGAW